MKNGNARRRSSIRPLILAGAFIIAAVAVIVPVYSVHSSSLPAGSSQAGVASGSRARAGQTGSLAALNPMMRASRPSTLGAILPIPSSSPETIETFAAADCTTPKTVFVLGETVCVVVNFVTESNRFVNWISPPDSTVAFSSPTIPDNLTHSYFYTPTVAGPWKATIADPSDSSIIPTYFDVVAPGPINTYAAGCSSPQFVFNLGTDVCAKVTGGLATPGRRIAWSDPSGFIRQVTPISVDPQNDTFSVPSTPTSTLSNDAVVTNLGTWRVSEISSRGGLIAFTTFVVKNPANATAELSINKSAPTIGDNISAGSTAVFHIVVSNNGPDAAASVQILDSVPANTTFVSITPSAGCTTPMLGGTGLITCNIASLARGASAIYDVAVSVSAGATAGTLIANTATVDSPTSEANTDDNSSTSIVRVTDAGTAGCTLNCPADMTVQADTTQAGIPGAFVTFSAASGIGNCGAIKNSPGSGSFFTVGSHLITSSSYPDPESAVAGASCTFTVTVVDTPPPTISCPSDKTVTAASGQSSATVSVGTPTTVPSTGVTVVGIRSDDPNCTDTEIDPGCTPVPLTDPYPVGTTTIVWTVIQSNGQRASCTQQIHVLDGSCGVDTENPTITAPPAVTVGTGPDNDSCTVALDDELGSVCTANCQPGEPTATDNCSVHVSVTGIPFHNAFPIGTTTVTYTATDPSGNHASATQLVTVFDNTPPIIVAPPDASYTCLSEVPSGAAAVALAHGTNPNLPNGGPPTDNCSAPVVTYSDSSTGAGSAASPRIITRTYTATDTSPLHNSSSSVQIITVIDPTPPTFTFVPPSLTAYTGPGAITCSTVVSDATLGTATATDNCSVTIQRSGVPSGNVFPKGDTTITYTATDPAGNSVVATQTVTVIDNTPPTITCAANMIVDYNAGVNGATVTYTAPVGTDNCPGATTVQTAGLASGSTFPLGTTTNTFTVTDAVGNTTSCSFKVTVALTSLIGLDSVTMTGSGYADSYSSAGGYPATKGSLANILSNGTITMGNSAKVWGNVRSTRAGVNMTGASQVTGNATAGTTVTTSGSATVLGIRTNNALAPVMTLPSVPACGPPYSPNSGISGTYSYNASTGDLTLSGVNIATLADGNYCFHNVTLGNSSQLKVNGPVVIKMTGTLNTSGASNLNNTTQIPSNLQILSSYSGSNGVIIGNSVSVYALIYAPNTAVNMSGAAPLFGTAAGKTLTIGNSGAIHYDTQLKTIWPAVWTLIFGP